MRLVDLTDKRFGRWRILYRAPNAGRVTRWYALCDCGKGCIIRSVDVLSGRSHSCGCLRREMLSTNKLIHGGKGSRLYRIWQGIKNRCLNPKCSGFRYYGGKGVKVFSKWLHFESFRDWSTRSGYADNLTIDRLDSAGNYTPKNCRWVSKSENSRESALRRWDSI